MQYNYEPPFVPNDSEPNGRSVAVVGSGKNGRNSRSVYRALSGVSFQGLDMNQEAPRLQHSQDPFIHDSLEPHSDGAHSLDYEAYHRNFYPSQEHSRFFSLGKTSGRQVQDSIGSVNGHPAPAYYDSSPNYPAQHYQPTFPTTTYPAQYPQPHFYDPRYQHQYHVPQNNPYYEPYRAYPVTSPPNPYPAQYSYPGPTNSGYPVPPPQPNISQNLQIQDQGGQMLRMSYTKPQSKKVDERTQVNHLFMENQQPRKKVFSADSLEKLAISPINSPTSPKEFHPAEVSRQVSVDKDSLEDVRPKLVSELKTFFERKSSSSTVNGDDCQSNKSLSNDASNTELDTSSEQTSFATSTDESSSVADKSFDSTTSKSSEENPQTLNTPAESSTDEESQESSSSIEASPPIEEEKSHIGDVSFLRATKDTPQTILASAQLVKATMLAPLKPKSFYIALDPKFELPDFKESKSSEELPKEETVSENSSSDGDCPSDYKESQLQLCDFVADWGISPDENSDEEIDEFFLVLDSSSRNKDADPVLEADEAKSSLDINPIQEEEDEDEMRTSFSSSKELSDDKESFLDKSHSADEPEHFLGSGKGKAASSSTLTGNLWEKMEDDKLVLKVTALRPKIEHLDTQQSIMYLDVKGNVVNQNVEKSLNISTTSLVVSLADPCDTHQMENSLDISHASSNINGSLYFSSYSPLSSYLLNGQAKYISILLSVAIRQTMSSPISHDSAMDDSTLERQNENDRDLDFIIRDVTTPVRVFNNELQAETIERRRISDSSGVSSLIDNDRRFSSSSEQSDHWEWLTESRKNRQNRYHAHSESNGKNMNRQDSNMSSSSCNSSGISSAGSEFSGTDRRMTCNSGISMLSNIDEEQKMEGNHYPDNVESNASETSLTVSVNGDLMSLPSPVWPHDQISSYSQCIQEEKQICNNDSIKTCKGSAMRSRRRTLHIFENIQSFDFKPVIAKRLANRLKPMKCPKAIMELPCDRYREDVSSLQGAYDSSESLNNSEFCMKNVILNPESDSESEDSVCSVTLNSSNNTREFSSKSTQFFRLRDSHSLPNLSDVGEANLLDEEGTRGSDSSFREGPFNHPQVGNPRSKKSSQSSLCSSEQEEIYDQFSDEEFMSEIEFENFSETEHDSDMENLNLDLFEPRFWMKSRKPSITDKLMKSPKISQIKRRLSFNSIEKSKELKEGFQSSLQRLLAAKNKFGRIVQKRMKANSQCPPSPAPSRASNPSPCPIYIHHPPGDPTVTYPLNQDSLLCSFMDQVRNESRQEDLDHCGSESVYTWSDADSDFEYVDLRTSKSKNKKSFKFDAKIGTEVIRKVFKKKLQNNHQKDRDVKLGHRSSNKTRNLRVPLAQWEPFFSVLLQDEKTFTSYRSEEMAIGDSLFYDLPRVRLDGGAKNFRRRWGYEMGPPPTLIEEEEDPYSIPFEEVLENKSQPRFDPQGDLAETQSLREDVLLRSYTDTSYDRACAATDRRGSAPATPILGARPTQEPPNNIFSNFFNKRSFKNNLKRTKSVTKLDRTKQNLAGAGGGSTLMLSGHGEPLASSTLSRLKSSRSHESLLRNDQHMMHTLDMTAGEVTIKPLHPSILGQEHCFQISSPSGIRYYSCRNAEERDKWVDSLRRAVNPHLDRSRRTENSLKIYIQEAKGVATKKRYFCELLLDNTLYARTSSKQKGELCFWGEQFEFKGLPTVETISVTLYREGDRRRKKEKNIPLGTVTIPVASVTSRSLIEKWHQVKSENMKATKESPSLRIRCKFQTVEVLPLEMYSDFLNHLKSNYWSLCSLLEPVVSVKAKEDIATTLVHVMQKENLAKHFLSDLVMMEIQRIDDSHLLFRGNSLATKAMEAFMKLVGEKYLRETLRQVINNIVEEGLDCEVDPTKVTPPAALQKHQENLIKVVRMTWNRILNSHAFFPTELRQCFCLYREKLESSGKEGLSDNLISASIFLRFLCPAILSPSLFNLTQEYPNERTSRNLTLIAKILQTLANFTKFQGKENFMEFMNDFIEKEQKQMRTFLRQISSPTPNDHRDSFEYDGDIDIGVQLSILHTLLAEATEKLATGKNAPTGEIKQHLEKLKTLLKDISSALKHPNINIVQQMSCKNDDTVRVHAPQVHSAEDSSSYQSLQRNIFRFNDPTVDCSSGSDLTYSPELPHQAIDSPRSSTLPRNSFLIGSARKPARDLTTDDDYVLYSALNEEKSKASQVPHSYSHTHLATSSTNINGHHHHFLNHAGWYNQRPNDPQYKEPHYTRPEHANNYIPMEPDRNSSGEGEPNMKGSQTSISQLSNVASSGYQSFAYSQSSSPVDLSITQHDATNNNHSNANQNGLPQPNSHQAVPYNSPLAFNNPMYNLNGVCTSPRTASNGSPPYHHQSHNPIPLSHSQQSPNTSSLSSSHSIEDISSSRLNSGNIRTQSSSGDESNACTPKADPRFPFKSSAPRTNPRFMPPSWRDHEGSSPEQTEPIFRTTPEHHHSASDLLSQSRRIKSSRRQSTELGSNRRLHRHFEDTDSSSDDQPHLQMRGRPSRSHHRSSETKTLEEYEKEILAIQSSMEMQLKMADAEETSTQINGKDVSTGLSNLTPIAKHNGQAFVIPEINPDVQSLQMKDILKTLLISHEELMKDQQVKASLMSEKDAVIHAQEERIAALNRCNTQLLLALTQLKTMQPDHCSSQDGNTISDTSDYKSSSC